MTVGRYAGKPIDTLPISYLRWMLLQDFPLNLIEAAKKKVDASVYNGDFISVSRHAIDMFSLRFMGRWRQAVEESLTQNGSMEKAPGFGTFIAKLAQDAWERGKDVSKHRHQDDGVVKELDGIKYVFAVSKHYPSYKEVVTVMGE